MRSRDQEMIIREDCRHFRGDVPCRPHKEEGCHCDNCSSYDRVTLRILIIKLGAAGDVIRTTPLVTRLKAAYPGAEITWLTLSPEFVPSSVDKVLSFDLKSIVYLLGTRFDILYNLDKDPQAAALTAMIQSGQKRGFGLHADTGKCAPLDNAARHKWLTGLFDDVSRVNTKSYPEEIFEICGFEFAGEEYLLDLKERSWDIAEERPLIGLNTGCGSRWTTRLWADGKWIALARMLKTQGYGVMFLGGPEEDEKNRNLSWKAGVSYPGCFPMKDFVSLVNQCDLVVTGVTMAMHIAIGLKKKIVLFNNIFNKNEFELYGLGEVIEPDVECKGCYKQKCETNCMELIDPASVFEAVTRQSGPVRRKR